MKSRIIDLIWAGGVLPVIAAVMLTMGGVALYNVTQTRTHDSQKAEYIRNKHCKINVQDTTPSEFDQMVVWCRAYLHKDLLLEKINQ